MTGVGDNDTSVIAGAGEPGGWWDANEVSTLLTVCYMPVDKTTISGVSGDKYDKTYYQKQNEPITHEEWEIKSVNCLDQTFSADGALFGLSD
mgnify:CR=1 FL=1